MARIIAIDYGTKRCGLAVSDPENIIANGLTTVNTNLIFDFLNDYFTKEAVSTIVIGLPKKMNGQESDTMKFIHPFVGKLKKIYPDKKIELIDERFTTKIAFQAMIASGVKKKDRNNKNGIVDMVSATIILETYLESLSLKIL